MKGFLYLVDKNIDNSGCIFSGDFYTDYSLKFSIDLNDKFSDTINKIKEELKDSLEMAKSVYMIENSESDQAMISIIDSYKDKEEQLLDDIEFIKIDYTHEEVAKYIKLNPEIKNKKIVLNETFNLSWENLNEIEKIFGADTDCLYFYLAGNSEFVSFKDCKQTLIKIKTISDEAKKLNMSPIEEIMYVYDVVRDRVYKKEEDSEDYKASRDLTSVLLGDKIVCQGFAEIFSAILDNLNIKNRLVFLVRKDKKSGHCRNVVYVKDPKYNIDGIYYFDPTWNSKRDNNNFFLSSYRYFAKTKEQMNYYSNYAYKDQIFGDFNSKFIDDFENFVKENGIKKLPNDIRMYINSVAIFMTGKNLIPNLLCIDNMDLPEGIRESFDLEKTIKKLKRLNKKFQKPISPQTYLEILYNVRKKQYYNNPVIYQLSINELYNILMNSGWKFCSSEIELLKVIFDYTEAEVQWSCYEKYIKSNNLDREIEGVKLARTLKNVLERRQEENE